MKRKTNISVRNNLGTRVISNMIVGETSNEYTSGDILDANAVHEKVAKEISDLVNLAPEALDTLGEIADVVQANQDAFMTALSTKAPLEGDAPLLSVGSARKLEVEEPTVGSFFSRTSGGNTDISNGLAKLQGISGKSVKYNQLVNSDATSITVTSGHKYFSVIEGVKSVETSNGNEISVTGGTDIVIDLTSLDIDSLTTVAQVEDWLAKNWGESGYYNYNTGSIINVNMTGIESIGRNLLDENGNAQIIGNYDVGETYESYYGICDTHGAITFTDKYGNSETITPDSNGKFLIEKNGTLHVTSASNNCAVFLWWDGSETNFVEHEVNVSRIDVSHVYGKLDGAGSLVRVFTNGMAGFNGVADTLTVENGVTTATKFIGVRAYISGDESDAAVLTDGVTTYYVLATPEVYTNLVYQDSEYFENNTSVTLPITYEVDNWGIENILPKNNSIIKTAKPTISFIYSVDTVETINTILDSIDELRSTKIDMTALETYITYEEMLEILQSLDENYYGITWTDSNTTPTRIGNPTFHRSLPIQKMMRRCMVADDGTVYGYISNTDPTKYLDGTVVDYTGTHGQCMVEIPEYHFDAYSYDDSGTTTHVLILYPYSTGGQLSKKVYASAFEATSNDADSTASTKKLFSICTTNFTVTNNSVSADSLTYTTDAAKYKGGNRSGSYGDSDLNSLLGRPVTNLTRGAFRSRAAARGTGWSQLYWDAYMAIVRLYVVEYCSFDSQALYNSSSTSGGYKQGGLGPGVSELNSTAWNNWNKYNPFVPCGITKSLGNETGIVSYVVPAAAEHSYSTTTNLTVSVPSYRGIENPFGHIWNWTDGINIYSDSTSEKTTVYTCNDVANFADNTSTNYVERVTFTTPSNGYIKTWNWDQNGDFIPTGTGGSASSYLYDYSYWSLGGWRVLRSGGGALYGAFCGWFYFLANDDSSAAYAAIGGRLYYTPSE